MQWHSIHSSAYCETEDGTVFMIYRDCSGSDTDGMWKLRYRAPEESWTYGMFFVDITDAMRYARYIATGE